MPTPLLNEHMIIEELQLPVNITTIGQLQAQAILATVDSYDRHLKREPFVDGMSTAFALHSAAGRLQTLISIQNLIKTGAQVPEKLDSAIKELTDLAGKHRDMLKMHMHLVIQCPWEDDKIH